MKKEKFFEKNKTKTKLNASIYQKQGERGPQRVTWVDFQKGDRRKLKCLKIVASD
ncbi:MAG: hypothetical protein K5796_03605 [Lachnospiraceae bacterium]|nr:hypothetical protein [Lachnospiraceae bacterium]